MSRCLLKMRVRCLSFPDERKGCADGGQVRAFALLRAGRHGCGYYKADKTTIIADIGDACKVLDDA